MSLVNSNGQDTECIVNEINIGRNSTITERVLKKRKNCANQLHESFITDGEEITRWRKIKGRQKTRWLFTLRVLIPLVILNVSGHTNAVETRNSLVASLLGWVGTCSIGSQQRACTLALSCWLKGGTRVEGCGGGWLLACCSHEYPTTPSSEWKYKLSPPQLRQVPQRSVVPTNVLRRRVDEDPTQMDCGIPASRIFQKRIIGGRKARFAEFPWQAHIRILEFQCGGVLVSRRLVATAAHCVSLAMPRDVTVRLGALDPAAADRREDIYSVAQKILHPRFEYRATQPDRYDVALLVLSRAVRYSARVLPVCLPRPALQLRGRSALVAGWGNTDAGAAHTPTNALRSATVPILSTDQCIEWHQSKQISVEIHSEMICAGHSDGHQDACLGDSGGPLIVLDSGRYYLVGITSAGFGCGVDHQPGIYHNVKVTSNWIKSVIAAVSRKYPDDSVF